MGIQFQYKHEIHLLPVGNFTSFLHVCDLTVPNHIGYGENFLYISMLELETFHVLYLKTRNAKPVFINDSQVFLYSKGIDNLKFSLLFYLLK